MLAAIQEPFAPVPKTAMRGDIIPRQSLGETARLASASPPVQLNGFWKTASDGRLLERSLPLTKFVQLSNAPTRAWCQSAFNGLGNAARKTRMDQSDGCAETKENGTDTLVSVPLYLEARLGFEPS